MVEEICLSTFSINLSWQIRSILDMHQSNVVTFSAGMVFGFRSAVTSALVPSTCSYSFARTSSAASIDVMHLG